MRLLSTVLCLVALVACAARSEREAASDASVADATRVEDAGVQSTTSPVQIPAECVGRRSGEPFCVDASIRVCSDLVPSTRSECGKLERCVMVDSEPECVCVPGAVDRNGQCVAAVADCSSATHGCDPLTSCNMVGGEPSCGACPAGYAGDGESGCHPQLLSLTIAQGSLQPAFSPDVSSYRLQLPAAHERVMILATVSDSATIEIEGVELASDGAWTSSTLSTGEHTIEVTVIARTGLATRYALVVERTDEM